MLECAEMSVLERQKAVLERLYNQSIHQLSSLPHQNHANENFDVFGSGFSNSYQETAVSNSSITPVSPPPEKDKDVVAPTQNVMSTKKRKAEFHEERQRGTSENNSKENSKTSEIQKPDYIHVRARRGQATDSHSIAERARREKISKKMKYLQDLVPGCNKVTGKAGMLDEIINYVQSLQKQVEFLSMKLALLNPHIDNFFTKDFPTYMVNFPTLAQHNLIQHQRKENCLMSFQDASSPMTVIQQQPTFETDFQSLFHCQL